MIALLPVYVREVSGLEVKLLEGALFVWSGLRWSSEAGIDLGQWADGIEGSSSVGSEALVVAMFCRVGMQL